MIVDENWPKFEFEKYFFLSAFSMPFPQFKNSKYSLSMCCLKTVFKSKTKMFSNP